MAKLNFPIFLIKRNIPIYPIFRRKIPDIRQNIDESGKGSQALQVCRRQ